MNRPKLTDPQEYNLIKSIYFKNKGEDFDNPINSIDPIERLERLEAKQRSKNKSSR